MFRTTSNGQSIYQYIPPDLRRMFYKNPARVHASHNGLDPYGFSTEGLVLYLPLWALKGSTFKSVDAYKTTATVTTATWQPNGRDFTPGTPDYITLPAAFTTLDFTAGAFSIIVRLNIDDLTTHKWVFNRGLRNTDGYEFYIDPDGAITFWSNQAAAGQYSISLLGAVTTGAVYTIGLSRDGTSAIPYSNGVSVAGTTGSHTNPKTSSRSVKIGIHDDITQFPFDGTMIELLAYNRALSAEEHLDTHNKLKWRV